MKVTKGTPKYCNTILKTAKEIKPYSCTVKYKNEHTKKNWRKNRNRQGAGTTTYIMKKERGHL